MRSVYMAYMQVYAGICRSKATVLEQEALPGQRDFERVPSQFCFSKKMIKEGYSFFFLLFSKVLLSARKEMGLT